MLLITHPYPTIPLLLQHHLPLHRCRLRTCMRKIGNGEVGRVFFIHQLTMLLFILSPHCQLLQHQQHQQPVLSLPSTPTIARGGGHEIRRFFVFLSFLLKKLFAIVFDRDRRRSIIMTWQQEQMWGYISTTPLNWSIQTINRRKNKSQQNALFHLVIVWAN